MKTYRVSYSIFTQCCTDVQATDERDAMRQVNEAWAKRKPLVADVVLLEVGTNRDVVGQLDTECTYAWKVKN